MYAFFVSFFLFSRRLPRSVRLALFVFAVFIVIAGVIYAVSIFRTLNERSHSPRGHEIHPHRSSIDAGPGRPG
jgi:hypothetical protein